MEGCWWSNWSGISSVDCNLLQIADWYQNKLTINLAELKPSAVSNPLMLPCFLDNLIRLLCVFDEFSTTAAFLSRCSNGVIDWDRNISKTTLSPNICSLQPITVTIDCCVFLLKEAPSYRISKHLQPSTDHGHDWLLRVPFKGSAELQKWSDCIGFNRCSRRSWVVD